jgi:hypothetical protein
VHRQEIIGEVIRGEECHLRNLDTVGLRHAARDFAQETGRDEVNHLAGGIGEHLRVWV